MVWERLKTFVQCAFAHSDRSGTARVSANNRNENTNHSTKMAWSQNGGLELTHSAQTAL